MKPGPTLAMMARASLFRRFTDTNVYGTVMLKYEKLATKYTWIYDHFYSVARKFVQLHACAVKKSIQNNSGFTL